MIKKIGLAAAVLALCGASYALGYSGGGSNIGYYYPSFSSYLSYDPGRAELERYLDEAREYVDSCNADIRMIAEARDRAVEEANAAVRRYNGGY